jgi:hypothetical protein
LHKNAEKAPVLKLFTPKQGLLFIGVTGFEPAASWSRIKKKAFLVVMELF